MSIESPNDLLGLVKVGRVVALTLAAMRDAVQPGITTAELDTIAERTFSPFGAQSAPMVTYNYPGHTCVSVNDEVAHGIPGERTLQKGDLVKIDVSLVLDGYYADAAETVGVPPLPADKQRLLDCARQVRDDAVAAARAGQPLNRIGRAAQRSAEGCGYTIVKEMAGHGLGRALHEAPSVPNYFLRRAKQRLNDGLVIAIEPHIGTSNQRVVTNADGWTLRTADGSPVANFEHTVVVTDGTPLIVTTV